MLFQNIPLPFNQTLRKLVNPFGRGVQVNLNKDAADSLCAALPDNPLLDVAKCAIFVDNVAKKKYDAQWSWGGYLEDRSCLLRGSNFVIHKGPIHLGVDINVPANTSVSSAVAGKVLRIDDDARQPSGQGDSYGWGPRIFISLDEKPELVFLYAHLTQISVKIGQRVKPSDEIGKVGNYPLNGNCFPHLHLQAVTKTFFDSLAPGNLDKLEAHCQTAEVAPWQKICPDPIRILESLQTTTRPSGR